MGEVTRFRGTRFVYYESRKRELKTRPMYECRYDERLKTKSEKSTRLVYSGLQKDRVSSSRCGLSFFFIMNQESES
jgi:hypothetical protein